MLLGIRYSRDNENGEITHDNKIVLLSAQGKILHTLNDLSQKEEDLLNAIH
jgi:cytochrome oxidase Cu insertion factor (SCO1/SenC/PrrC family)